MYSGPRWSWWRAASVCALALSAAACRNSTDNNNGVKLVPSPLSANGCTGPDQVFTPPQTRTPVALATLAIGPMSQITAAGDAELLFATGANATVVQIDVSGVAPVETELIGAGEIATLLATAGIATAPELSGLCVLDADTLLAMEHTSNTLVSIDRHDVDPPAFWAGLPDELGGFANGVALPLPGNGQARFHFDGPSQICPTAPGATQFVFVADTANHAVRVVSQGFVNTLCGSGTPFFQDGDMQSAGFDTPVGLSTACNGSLFISERGLAAGEGNRLRQVLLGALTFFGQSGTVVTRAGNGTDDTIQGDGELASLAQPVSPLTTTGNDTYWIDASLGILRRMTGALDTVDCPLWSDCAAAKLGGGDFTPGGVLSLTQTPAGILYVMDATAGVLYRVTP